MSLSNKKPKIDEEKGLLEEYYGFIDSGDISVDENQERTIKSLDKLSQALRVHRIENHGFFARMMGKRKPCMAKGLYIYGDVGRGKSMLMDLFYNNIPVIRKRRVHFHAFMAEIHERLNKKQGESNPLVDIAKDIVDESWVLCFDEFQVNDIADAMILGNLFQALFEENVVVIATSNRHPDNLYKHGLQREQFLPFISIFKEKMNIINLQGEVDYRLSHFRNIATSYFTTFGVESEDFMMNSYKELTNGAIFKARKLKVQGREIVARRTCGNLAWFTFEELCEQPLGASDYRKIASEFDTILLSYIPKMGKQHRNEAKRFILLIDELYEHKTKLICTAEVPPQDLYRYGDGSFEFERTVSRLMEMQSEEYIGEEHVV